MIVFTLFQSAPPPPPPEEETPNSVDQNEENNAESNKENSPVTKADEVKESDPSELPSDKKTDQVYGKTRTSNCSKSIF